MNDQLTDKKESGLDNRINIALNLSLDDTFVLLKSFDLSKRSYFQRLGVMDRLKVNVTKIDNESCEFRIWVFNNLPDIEMAGILNRVSDRETMIMGETRRGWLNFSVLMLIIFIFSILFLRQGSVGAVLFFLGSLAYLLLGVYLTVSVTPAWFTQSIKLLLDKHETTKDVESNRTV